jgi:hypothetical protein
MSEIKFRGGRKKDKRGKPRLKLRSFLAETLPERTDWGTGISDWPMYLNDRYGDCTFAAAGHIIQALSHYGSGETRVSDSDILAAYSAVSGFDPATGANDDGCYIQDIMDHWRKNGVGGHKILAFAEVDVNDREELRKALQVFGHVYLGMDFPRSAMDQFNKGERWSIVNGSPIDGGHAINAQYYDESDDTWKIVTWGTLHDVDQEFFDQYFEEAWVVITPEWLDAAGKSPEGIDLAGLGQEFANLTGESNPFPDTPQPESHREALLRTKKNLLRVGNAWLATNPAFYSDMQEAYREWASLR